MTDFIEQYDGALDAATCDEIVLRFIASDRKAPGITGHGFDVAKKDSLDLLITGRPEWQSLHQRLLDNLESHLARYVRKYPHLVTGAFPLQLNAPLDRLSDERLRDELRTLFRFGFLNLQQYPQGRGGYHHWHSEIYPRDQYGETLHRALFVIYYLNDVADGGETEFFYQKRKIKPKRGTLVLAPAGFTHTHKGAVPRTESKFVATSWVMFQRAEDIFAARREKPAS